MSYEASRTDLPLETGLFRQIVTLLAAQPLLADKIDQIERLYRLLRDEDEVRIFIDLLHRASCYHGHELSAASDRLAKHVTQVWNLSYKETCFVAKDLEDKASSADAALQIFKTALVALDHRFVGDNFVGRMRQAAKPGKWKNIVLVDDFVGTGRKALRKVQWLRKHDDKEAPRKLFILSFVAQATCLEVLDRHVSGIHADLFLERAISDHYDEVDRERYLSAIDRIEGRFGGIDPSISKGYEGSESIYFPMLWNTPNNVFPMFWYNKHHHDDGFKPILIRSPK